MSNEVTLGMIETALILAPTSILNALKSNIAIS